MLGVNIQSWLQLFGLLLFACRLSSTEGWILTHWESGQKLDWSFLILPSPLVSSYVSHFHVIEPSFSFLVKPKRLKVPSQLNWSFPLETCDISITSVLIFGRSSVKSLIDLFPHHLRCNSRVPGWALHAAGSILSPARHGTLAPGGGVHPWHELCSRRQNHLYGWAVKPFVHLCLWLNCCFIDHLISVLNWPESCLNSVWSVSIFTKK